MGKMTPQRKAWSSFVTELRVLVDEYSVVELDRLGFPKDWEERLRNVQP